MRTSARSWTTSSDSAAEATTAERLILVYGNCQAHWLGGLLLAQGVGLVAIVGEPFGFYPEFHGLRPVFVTPAEAAELATHAKVSGRQVTLLEQTSPMSSGLDEATQKLASHNVRFPHLEVRAYWHPWLSKVGDSFAPERIRRQFDFDLAAIRRSEAKAGWPSELSDHLLASHRQTPHFYTLNHPTADLMQRLHAGVCAGLVSRGGLDPQAYAWAQSEIVDLAGMGFIAQHPLHHSVIDALDLEWARQGWYGLWVEAYFATGDGRLKEARDGLIEAIADPNHDPHIHATLGTVLTGLGDLQGATRAFGHAHRAYPQNPTYAEAWLESHTGREGAAAARLKAEFEARLPSG